MKKFKDFKYSINESVLYYSDRLQEILMSILKSEKYSKGIANDILFLFGSDIDPDFTFLDIDDNNEGNITYTTMENAVKNSMISSETADILKNANVSLHLRSEYLNEEPNMKRVYDKSRNTIRMGRFINRVFPGKFTSTEIEEFVDKFKLASKKDNLRFSILTGSDILLGYKRSNLLEYSGELGNSCMIGKPDSFFEIYINNEDIISMLTLFDGNKIIGRALVWKLEKDFNGSKYFMDRVYTIENYLKYKFYEFADNKNWIYKKNNNYIQRYNKYRYIELVAELGYYNFDYYPYMDTFKYLDVSYGFISNYLNSLDLDNNIIRLESTNGLYESVSDIYSYYYETYFKRNEAILGFIVSVDRETGKPKVINDYTSDDFSSPVDENTKWYWVLSEIYDDFIDYPVLESNISYYDSINNIQALDCFSTYLYPVLNNQTENNGYIDIDYVSYIDAEVLGLKIDINDKNKSDKFEYYSKLSMVINIKKYKLEVSNILKNYNDIRSGRGQLYLDIIDKDKLNKDLGSKTIELELKVSDLNNRLFFK